MLRAGAAGRHEAPVRVLPEPERQSRSRRTPEPHRQKQRLIIAPPPAFFSERGHFFTLFSHSSPRRLHDLIRLKAAQSIMQTIRSHFTRFSLACRRTLLSFAAPPARPQPSRGSPARHANHPQHHFHGLSMPAARSISSQNRPLRAGNPLKQPPGRPQARSLALPASCFFPQIVPHRALNSPVAHKNTREQRSSHSRVPF